MPTLEIDGMRFTGTQEECAAFARSLRAPTPVTQPTLSDRSPAISAPEKPLKGLPSWLQPGGARSYANTPTVTAQIEVSTLAFLRALRDQPGGLDSQAVQGLVGASHPKGIGSRLGMIKNHLLVHGFKDTDAVYTSIRHQLEGRRWFPGPSIADAIFMLEKTDGGRQATLETA